MKFKRLSKEIISFLIIFSLIFSASFSALNLLHANATPQGQLIYDGSIAANTGEVVTISGTAVDFGGKENLLADKYYDLRSFNSAGDPPTRYHNANLEYMTDGIVNNVDAYSGRNIEFTFYLENKVAAEYFVLINRAEKNLQTFQYEIYGSSTLAGVYSEDSLLATYSRTDTGTEDKQLNVFRLNSAESIEYFRIKFIKANATDAYSIRFCEIALLGEVTGAATSSGVSESDDAVIPTTDTLSPAIKSFYANGTPASAVYNINNLDDGLANEFSSAFNFADYDGGNVKWYTNGERYFDIVYDLGGKCNLTKALVLNASNLYLRTGKYSIYAAETETDLFKDTSKIIEFENKAKSQKQLWNINRNMESVRYVALRITDPVSDHGNAGITTVTATQNNINTRIWEFRVYGTRVVEAPDKCELFFDGSLEEGATKGVFSLDGDTILSSSENILKDKYLDVTSYTSDGDKRNVNSSGLSSVTDGKAENTPSADASSGAHVDFDFYIRDTVVPEYFTIINRSEINLQTYKYQIFAADSHAALDSAESLMATYERTDSATADKRVNIFKFNQEINTKYLRVRILRGNHSVDNSARICEMMLYGEVKEKAEKTSVTSDNIVDLPQYESNLVPKSIQALQQVPDETSDAFKMYNTDALHDGASDKEFSVDTRFAAFVEDSVVWYTDDNSAYVTLTYDFGSEAVISNISLLHHSCLYLRTGKYEIYTSNEKEDLYNSENRLIEFTNHEKTQRQIYDLTAQAEAVKARYVGLKVLDPVTDHGNTKVTSIESATATNNIYLRLLEFKVFGEYIDENYLNLPVITVIDEKAQGKQTMTDEEFAEIGDSLISGQTATVRTKNIRVEPLEKITGRLTDGIVKTVYHEDGTVTASHVDFSDNRVSTLISKEAPLDIIYKLGDGETLYDIDKILYLGLGDSGKDYYTGEYQIYGAEFLDDLFKSESLLFDYDYTRDDYARGHMVTFKENYKPRICYFAIRITKPVTTATTWVYPRVSEIAIYGEKADIIAKPDNLARNMPINAYLSDAEGDLSNVSSSNLTATEVKYLSDGNPDTYAKVKTGGKDLEIVYNLCNEAEISTFNMESLSTNRINEFKIYAAMDLNDIWSEDSVIYHYRKSAASTNLNGITYKNPIKIRYVRVSVLDYDGGDYCYISNINVIGMDDQMLKYKSLTGNITESDVVVFEQDIKTKEIVGDVVTTSNQATGLFDTDKFTSDTIWGGKDGEKSLNIQFYLGDLKNINRLEVYFLKNRENYWPMEMDIYLAEDLESLIDKDAKPVYSFTEAPKDQCYTVDIVPQLARYARLSFKTSNPNLKEIYDTINIAFTEIVVMGTNVKGQQRSDEYDGLLDFYDKDTDISWEIVRLDKNDIFTKVASSKLVVSKTTDEQSLDIMKNTYYKVRDDKLYQIKFYDITGAEITNFNGRKVRVLIPTSKDASYGEVLVGAAKEDNIDLQNTPLIEKNGKVYLSSELQDENLYKFIVADLDNNDILPPEGSEDTGNLQPDGSDDEQQEDFVDEIPEESDDESFEDSLENTKTDISPETGEGQRVFVALIFSLVTSAAVLYLFRKRHIRRI